MQGTFVVESMPRVIAPKLQQTQCDLLQRGACYLHAPLRSRSAHTPSCIRRTRAPSFRLEIPFLAPHPPHPPPHRLVTNTARIDSFMMFRISHVQYTQCMCSLALASTRKLRCGYSPNVFTLM